MQLAALTGPSAVAPWQAVVRAKALEERTGSNGFRGWIGTFDPLGRRSSQGCHDRDDRRRAREASVPTPGVPRATVARSCPAALLSHISSVVVG